MKELCFGLGILIATAAPVLLATGGQEPDDNAPLVALLRDRDPKVRQQALHQLVERKASAHVDAIAAMLDDPDNLGLRSRIIHALGTLKAHRHARKIVPFLGDADTPRGERLNHLAYWALKNLDGSEAEADVVPFLSHENSRIRLHAVRLLGHWKARDRETVIANALKDEDPVVRESAVDALANLPATETAADVGNLLDDPTPEVRSRAAVALGKINATKFADRIVAGVKAKAIEAVRQFGNADSAKVLAGHVDKVHDANYVQAACLALLKLDPKSHMNLVLSRAPWGQAPVIYYELNRLGAPKLYERIGALRPPGRGPHEHDTLARLATVITDGLGVPVIVDPSVPLEVRSRAGWVDLVRQEPHRSLPWLLNHSWPECTYLMDEETGEIRIVTVEKSKRQWLEWARAGK